MNGKHQNQRGHLLLVAIVLVTVISIALATVIQPIHTTSVRQKEALLLYRGEHMAAGIRRFYFDKGRFPFDLEELVDTQPRYVRRVYLDPMTEDGEWNLVYLQTGDQESIKDLDGLARTLLFGERTEETNSENLEEQEPGQRKPRGVFAIRDRQITGVRSKSDAEGFTVRGESRIYADWLFSALPDRKDQTIKRIRQQLGQTP